MHSHSLGEKRKARAEQSRRANGALSCMVAGRGGKKKTVAGLAPLLAVALALRR